MNACSVHPESEANRRCNRCGAPHCQRCGSWPGAAVGICPLCPWAVRPDARLSQRFAAHCIDAALVVMPPFAVWFFWLYGVAQANDRPLSSLAIGDGAPMWLLLLLWVASLGVELAFQFRVGQSVGKRVIGLRVVRASGEPADAGQVVLLRNVVPLLLSPLCGIRNLVDVFWLLLPPHRKLGDRLARTRVVDAPALPPGRE